MAEERERSRTRIGGRLERIEGGEEEKEAKKGREREREGKKIRQRKIVVGSFV